LGRHERPVATLSGGERTINLTRGWKKFDPSEGGGGVDFEKEKKFEGQRGQYTKGSEKHRDQKMVLGFIGRAKGMRGYTPLKF